MIIFQLALAAFMTYAALDDGLNQQIYFAYGAGFFTGCTIIQMLTMALRKVLS